MVLGGEGVAMLRHESTQEGSGNCRDGVEVDKGALAIVWETSGVHPANDHYRRAEVWSRWPIISRDDC